MYNLIKKLLKQGEPSPTTIAFDTIPSLLAEHDQAAHNRLISQTNNPIHSIRNATAQLQHIVNGIEGAEHDPAIHPKLKSIAKNSLPLFVKAMNSSLSKELPEDVEEFYEAAVDCVKGCLNALRGQGRYLQVVFPEEMKNVRIGIDAIGREINLITGSMTEFRKKKEVIRDIRRSFDAVHDIRVDFAKSSGKNQRIEGRITETTERIAAIESEINRISVDEGMKTVREMQSELAAIERDRDECTRIYAAMSMTASHVFRKSEKIAAKKHMDAEINTLKHTMELLSGHNTPDIQSLAGALAASCPIAERMIADGEIILKNKEERGIFSDSTRYSKYLCTKCGEIETLQARVMEAENALSSHPLLMRLNSLSREKTQLESMLVKEEHSRQELAEWTARTRDRIPVLIKELQEKLEGMTGGNVQLQMDNQLLS